MSAGVGRRSDRSAHHWWQRPGAAFWHARFPLTLLCVTVALAVTTALMVEVVAEVTLTSGQPVRFLPMYELLPFISLICTLIAVSPRTSPWERFGTSAFRRMTLVAGLVCFGLPHAVLFAGVLALPSEATSASWLWMLTNLIAWTSLGLILLAFAGPISSAVLMCIAFVGVIVLQQTAGPILPWLPFAGSFDLEPRYWTLVAAPVALGVRQLRLGSACLDDRLFRNSE